jgi:hypothetical protein
MSKNLCGKMRNVNEPYEVWVNHAAGWEWRVLKKYKNEDGEKKDPYARWFCAVKSPATFNSYDLGDVYVQEVKRNAVKVSDDYSLKNW